MAKLRSKRKEIFLAAYAKTINIGASAKAAGVSRAAVWMWRQKDLDFIEKMEEAEACYLDGLEQLVYKMALDGEGLSAPERLRHAKWVLERRRPNRWSDKRDFDKEEGRRGCCRL